VGLLVPFERNAGITGLDPGVVVDPHHAFDLAGVAVEQPLGAGDDGVLIEPVWGNGGRETEQARARLIHGRWGSGSKRLNLDPRACGANAASERSRLFDRAI
jgi:hypothetical protein